MTTHFAWKVFLISDLASLRVTWGGNDCGGGCSMGETLPQEEDDQSSRCGHVSHVLTASLTLPRCTLVLSNPASKL